jgi:2-polyprenyl-6-methoxyphenol hydroxylase-like FAD-dependent oxidoreductase
MNILISGGGIAGSAAGLLLHRAGHKVTIIDKAPSFQKLGYGLSLKGFGIDLIEQLGLLPQLKKHELPISVFEVYSSGNKLLREIPKHMVDAITGGAIPVARAELHGVLYDAAKKVAPFTFGTHITGIQHLSSTEQVSFSNGKTQEFDLVVVAEGLRSSTRQLLWVTDEGWQPFDITYAAAVINQPHGFKIGHAYSYRGIGKTLAFFPVTNNQVAIQGYFRGVYGRVKERSHAKDILLETFGDFPPHIVQLLEAISPDDYIFYDSIAMVKPASLSQERVVLLGDAGYCPTFLSGMGASLSLLGAKILSDSLHASPDVETALDTYNATMQPIATHFQDNAQFNMIRELPTNAIKAALMNTVMRVAPFSLLTRSASKQLSIEQRLISKPT